MGSASAAVPGGFDSFHVEIIERGNRLRFAFFGKLKVFFLQALDGDAILVDDRGVNLHQVNIYD